MLQRLCTLHDDGVGCYGMVGNQVDNEGWYGMYHMDSMAWTVAVHWYGLTIDVAFGQSRVLGGKLQAPKTCAS